MTIKELAITAGCNEKTVRRIGKELFPLTTKNGVKTDYDKSQCFDIMQKLPKKNLVQMSELPSQNVQGIDYEAIGKMIGMAVTAALTPVVMELKNIKSSGHLQIEAPKEDYFSLLAYCSIHEIKTNRSELALHGKSLRRMTLDKGLTLKKIPDERWGQVNSYPVEILDEYFRI